MELLVERQQQSLLPSQTLTNFTGYPLEFSTFYLKKINEWPTIWTLDKFSVFLTQRRGAIRKLTFLSILNHPLNLQSMVACFLPSSRTGGAMKPVEQECLRERFLPLENL